MNSISNQSSVQFAGKWAIAANTPEKLERIIAAVQQDADTNKYEVLPLQFPTAVVIDTPQGKRQAQAIGIGFLTAQDAVEFKKTVQPQMNAFQAMRPLIEKKVDEVNEALKKLQAEMNARSTPIRDNLNAFWSKFEDGSTPTEQDLEKVSNISKGLDELQKEADDRSKKLQESIPALDPPPAFLDLIRDLSESQLTDLDKLEQQMAQGAFDPEVGK